jgi:hypothetical protein
MVSRTINELYKELWFTFYILNHHYNLETQYFLKLHNISKLFIFSAGAKLLRVVQLESMFRYKYLNIDSGATPIGSAGRAPDRLTILRKNSTKEIKKKKIWAKKEMKKKKLGAYDRLQVPDHSLRGYSHRERWSRTRWRINLRRTRKKISSPLLVASTRK